MTPFTANGPCLGTQLFINREDTPEQVRLWMRQIAEARLKIVRLFVFWDQVNPRRDVWFWDNYDAAFNEAAKLGIGIVPTLFAQTPPGWMRLVNNNQGVGDLDDASLWAAGRDYLRRAVERWRGHPALDSWIVWNEASMNVPRNGATLAQFRIWLAERYQHDIARYNKLYYIQLDRFEEVQFDASNPYSPVASRTEAIDWLEFGIDYLVGKVKVLSDDIRALDPLHPVHVNPHRILEAIHYHGGQSVWKEGGVVDFLGCSVHLVWHCTRFPYARRDRAVSMMNDVIRSATAAPNAYYWVSELQGGPALFSGFEAGTPTPEELYVWLWESVAAGARAVVFWCFNQRTSGGEGGEWGLLNQRGEPSRRLIAVTQVAKQIESYQDLLVDAQPPRTLVKILHSEGSWRLAMLEGDGRDIQNSRNEENAADAMCGAYDLITSLGYEVGFLDEPLLQNSSTALDGVRVLIVPGCVALEPATVQALARFTTQGGFVVADGLAGWKTADSWINVNQQALDALFGAELVDIEAHTVPAPLTVSLAEGGTLPGWLTRISFEPKGDTQTLARWDDGSAAVTRSASVLRIGTNFFQRYFALPTAEARAWFTNQFTKLVTEPFALLQSSPGVRLRRLLHPQGHLVVVINGGTATRVTIVSRVSGAWASAERVNASGTRVEVELENAETCVLLFVAQEGDKA